MEEYKLSDYIKLRKDGRRSVSVVQEIIDSAKLEGVTGQEIVDNYHLRYSERAHAGISMIVKAYRGFCRQNGYKFEKISLKRHI